MALFPTPTDPIRKKWTVVALLGMAELSDLRFSVYQKRR
jgi:hypothetical protein